MPPHSKMRLSTKVGSRYGLQFVGGSVAYFVISEDRGMRAVKLLALALVLTSLGEVVLVFPDRYKNLISAGNAGTFSVPGRLVQQFIR